LSGSVSVVVAVVVALAVEDAEDDLLNAVHARENRQYPSDDEDEIKIV